MNRASLIYSLQQLSKFKTTVVYAWYPTFLAKGQMTRSIAEK